MVFNDRVTFELGGDNRVVFSESGRVEYNANIILADGYSLASQASGLRLDFTQVSSTRAEITAYSNLSGEIDSGRIKLETTGTDYVSLLLESPELESSSGNDGYGFINLVSDEGSLEGKVTIQATADGTWKALTEIQALAEDEAEIDIWALTDGGESSRIQLSADDGTGASTITFTTERVEVAAAITDFNDNEVHSVDFNHMMKAVNQTNSTTITAAASTYQDIGGTVTVEEAGTYLVIATCTIEATTAADNTYRFAIRTGSVEHAYAETRILGSSVSTAVDKQDITLIDQVVLSANDVLKMSVYRTSTSGTNIARRFSFAAIKISD